MLEKRWHHNWPYRGPTSKGAAALERHGHYLLRGVLSDAEVKRLREDVLDIYQRVAPDCRATRSSAEAEMFRYEMFNRSALCQETIGHPALLEVIEPLLGCDCHVISCTAWRNPPGNTVGTNALAWHVDGGPHVPRRAGILWPWRIPYPVFVVATHVYLEDMGLAEGPTAFVPGSHTSGQVPPASRRTAETLWYRGRRSVAHIAKAGDVSFFVSDVWHRRLTPSPSSAGRFFLQTNYGRREIAQRVRASSEASHASPEALARAKTVRERQLIGQHEMWFYDG